jgi:hypothetical protein
MPVCGATACACVGGWCHAIVPVWGARCHHHTGTTPNAAAIATNPALQTNSLVASVLQFWKCLKLSWRKWLVAAVAATVAAAGIGFPVLRKSIFEHALTSRAQLVWALSEPIVFSFETIIRADHPALRSAMKDQLDGGPGADLLLLSSPPGSGISTMARDVLQDRRHVIYIEVHREEQDSAFWHTFCQAVGLKKYASAPSECMQRLNEVSDIYTRDAKLPFLEAGVIALIRWWAQDSDDPLVLAIDGFNWLYPAGKQTALVPDQLDRQIAPKAMRLLLASGSVHTSELKSRAHVGSRSSVVHIEPHSDTASLQQWVLRWAHEEILAPFSEQQAIWVVSSLGGDFQSYHLLRTKAKHLLQQGNWAGLFIQRCEL